MGKYLNDNLNEAVSRVTFDTHEQLSVSAKTYKRFNLLHQRSIS